MKFIRKIARLHIQGLNRIASWETGVLVVSLCCWLSMKNLELVIDWSPKIQVTQFLGCLVTETADVGTADDVFETSRLPDKLPLGVLTRRHVWSSVNIQYLSFHRKNWARVDSDRMLGLKDLQV